MERIEAEGVQDPVPLLVDEAVRVCRGTADDRAKWMKIANRGVNSFLGVLCEFEAALEGTALPPPRKPAAAFQARLNRVLPFPGAGA